MVARRLKTGIEVRWDRILKGGFGQRNFRKCSGSCTDLLLNNYRFEMKYKF